MQYQVSIDRQDLERLKSVTLADLAKILKTGIVKLG
jgi:hypothetical protein